MSYIYGLANPYSAIVGKFRIHGMANQYSAIVGKFRIHGMANQYSAIAGRFRGSRHGAAAARLRIMARHAFGRPSQGPRPAQATRFSDEGRLPARIKGPAVEDEPRLPWGRARLRLPFRYCAGTISAAP